MSRNLNKKKFKFFNKKNLLLFSSIILIFLLFIFFYFNINRIEIYIKKNINTFSNQYGYDLKSSDVKGIKVVKLNEIEKIIEPHLNKSIFILPLKDISKKIKENPWIKNVNISTNYKDIMYININEFKPVGVFLFNENYYYFDNKGKIIDLLKNNISFIDNFIVFSGKFSNIKAIPLLEILNKNKFLFEEKIKNANYIGERRWNLILDNGILLKLSEKNPETSLQNYFKLRKTLNKNEMNSIKAIDLIDFQKAIIQFR
tara:strand:+ start:122 stop:895 length:774 start_codon:yes stop_codon:yes gene_type:complete